MCKKLGPSSLLLCSRRANMLSGESEATTGGNTNCPTNTPICGGAITLPKARKIEFAHLQRSLSSDYTAVPRNGIPLSLGSYQQTSHSSILSPPTQPATTISTFQFIITSLSDFVNRWLLVCLLLLPVTLTKEGSKYQHTWPDKSTNNKVNVKVTINTASESINTRALAGVVNIVLMTTCGVTRGSYGRRGSIPALPLLWIYYLMLSDKNQILPTAEQCPLLLLCHVLKYLWLCQQFGTNDALGW